MKSSLSHPYITELSSSFLRVESKLQLQLWFTWKWLIAILLYVSMKKSSQLLKATQA